jgi:hypothetical protein
MTLQNVQFQPNRDTVKMTVSACKKSAQTAHDTVKKSNSARKYDIVKMTVWANFDTVKKIELAMKSVLA